MGIRFECPACGAKLNVKAELAGKRGACPKCQAKIQIPAGAPEQEAAAVVTGSTEAAAHVASPAANFTDASAAASTAPSASATAESKWFVRPPSGGQYGPAAEGVLRQWIQEGRITPDTLIWRDGDPDWKPASAVFSELVSHTSPVIAPAFVDRPATPVKSSVTLPNVPAAKDVEELDAASAATAMLLARRKRARSTGLLIMGILIVLVLVLLPILIIVLKNQGQPPAGDQSGRLPTVHSSLPEPRWG